MPNPTKTEKRQRRKARIRSKVSGTAEKPRLSVFKSNTSINAQLIDDEKGVTLAFAKGVDPKVLGKEIASKASQKGIKTVVFDRGGYIYTGKIKTLAESAREGGLNF